MPNVVNSDQYQVVQDLLERQDQALEQLDTLNERVEKAIEEVNAFRNDGQENVGDDHSAEGGNLEPNDADVPHVAEEIAPNVQKAA